MRLSQVTDKLLSQGYLDSRKLFSYTTAVGSLSGRDFQKSHGHCVSGYSADAVFRKDRRKRGRRFAGGAL